MEVSHSKVYEQCTAEKEDQHEICETTNSQSLSDCKDDGGASSTVAGGSEAIDFNSAKVVVSDTNQKQVVCTSTSQETVNSIEVPVNVSIMNEDKSLLGAHSACEDLMCLSKYDHDYQKPFTTFLDSLKASDIELNSTVSILMDRCSGLDKTVSLLTDRCSGLEKMLEDLECRNRTVERELALWQSETDLTKKMLRQASSTKAAASDASEKQQVVTTKTQDELDITKNELKRLGHELTDATSFIKDVSGKVTWLESEFQKFMRKHSLIVENLCPKEDKSATEMFLVFVNSVLNVAIEDGEIESVHVISQQGSHGSPEKRPRPILVTFSCYGTRSRVYKAWLGFRSSKMPGVGVLSGERGSGICIREYLTEIQDSSYHEAMQIREKHLIADCWTFKGKTYIRMLDGDVREFNKEQWLSTHETSSAGCFVM